jgi:hypothetical protein
LTAQPTDAERAAANEPHVPPTAAQTQHVEAARADKSLTASANHGVPPIAATPTAGNFKGPGVTHAAAFGAAAGAAAVGAHSLSPSVAVPHGVSNAHALPVPRGGRWRAGLGPAGGDKQSHSAGSAASRSVGRRRPGSGPAGDGESARHAARFATRPERRPRSADLGLSGRGAQSGAPQGQHQGRGKPPVAAPHPAAAHPRPQQHPRG